MSTSSARGIPPIGSSASNDSGSAQATSSNTTHLLEKAARLSLHRSTPDSEALASSDDEQESGRHLARISSQPLPKPARRPSWINEPTRSVNHKSAIGTTGAGLDGLSPVHTPDSSVWATSGSPLARVSSSDNSYPWGSSSIWSNGSNPKAPPSRLAEMVPEHHESGSFEDAFRSPTHRRDSNATGTIPFPIPLKPTLKAYRSQSYSVGQMDQESDLQQTSAHSQTMGNRTRTGALYAGLQQRGPRPGMINELAYDNTLLGQLEEVDDDDEEGLGHIQAAPGNRTQQQLERENALMRENNNLRQQLVNLSLSTQRGADAAQGLESMNNGFDLRRDTFSDTALEEVDDLADDGLKMGHYTIPLSSRGTRRTSDLNSGSNMPSNMSAYLNNRNIENIRRHHWQSQPGFPSAFEQSPSRRHSFAEVSIPKRQISLGAISTDFPTVMEHQDEKAYASTTPYHTQQPRSVASSESNRQQPSSTPRHLGSPPPVSRFQHHVPYDQNSHYFPGRNNLYMVIFKASRAEFYYVPAGVGLEIKEGDLVIVEADRGTDLGTVDAVDVPWSETKKLRDRQAEEHYRWLMMFSRRRADGTMSPKSATGVENPNNNGTTGTPSAPGSSDFALGRKEESELKPKMIKRLAYQHEIQQLKEKEANEAKAKRICQAKADEHGLDMEILDAEFQMDWKKLTFYYFADSYINFNSLVTDLFKTYKTRIWMSAINPASFQTPPAALSPPSLISPGAILPNSHESRQAVAPLIGPQQMGYHNTPSRGSHSGGLMRAHGGPNEMIQQPFWMMSQGVGAGGAPNLGYDGFYHNEQNNGEAHFGRYPGPTDTRGPSLVQPTFAQHMIAQHQQTKQPVGQQVGPYEMRSGPY